MTSLINQQFGRLTVIEQVPMPHSIKRKKRYWKCKCACGKEKLVSSTNLKNGSVASCGCARFLKKLPLYEKYGEEIVRNGITQVYWGRLISNANRRKIPFSISIIEAYRQYIKQNKICAYSGWPITFADNYRLRGNQQTASLDRIDSSKGYIKGNIQWLHKDVNRMKSNFSEENFLKICLAVSNKSLDKI